MKQSLNGKWKIHFTDGQRGGMPHYGKEDGNLLDADLKGIQKTISDDYDDLKWIDAAVPGEIHLDLWKAGIIDDPYVGINALKCRWVEEMMWYYRRVFDAPEASESTYAFLRFEGLDYGAIVYLNGQEIARHSNSFYPLSVDVSGKLKKQGNVLVVQLESGIYSVAEKPITHLYSATMSIDNLLHKRMWLRKPQSSCEWDWSPRLLNVGIYKSVFLYYSNDAIVEQVSLQSETRPDFSSGTLNARIFLSACSPKKKYRIRMTIDGTVYESEKLEISTHEASFAVSLADPELWYPIGYGAQRLYQVCIELLADGETVYKEDRKTGFRTVAFDQSPHTDGGNYCNLLVNGIRVFAKGGNFVPADMITAAITKERYETIVDRAIEANFNFLRVWGGGLYEADEFYEICNEKGILVWQEFIAACGTLPYNDPAFAADIEKEAVYQLRRLAGHPSLVVWCGNNEIDVWGVRAFSGHMPVDAAFYHVVLPRLVQTEDPEKYYQPTSPWSFDESPTTSDIVGDQHPWSIGFQDKDHRKYRDMVCRFPNEGGMLGPNSMDTIRRLMQGEEKLHTVTWDFHENMLESWMKGTSGDESIRFWTNMDPRQLPFEESIYVGGFIHAEALKEYIDSFRSKKFTCGSAIFWMYNDCWPCTRSWTIVDYYDNRTPAFYSVKRAFAPVRPIARIWENNLEFVISNDLLHEFRGSLRYGIMGYDGTPLLDKTIPITAAENMSTAAVCMPKGTYPAFDGKKAFAFCILYDDSGKRINDNHLLLSKYYEMEMAQPSIEICLKDGTAVFTTDKPAFGVCLDLDGVDRLEDNIFDLLPSIPYTIAWEGAEKPQVLYTLNHSVKK